jgi:hypothetical protein
MGRRGERVVIESFDGECLVRDIVRESLALDGMLESWGVVMEDAATRYANRVSSNDPIGGEQTHGVNSSALTDLSRSEPTAYKARVMSAAKMGDIGDAAKFLGVDERTVYRHFEVVDGALGAHEHAKEMAKKERDRASGSLSPGRSVCLFYDRKMVASMAAATSHQNRNMVMIRSPLW